MIARFLDCLALARTVLVLSERVSELSRRLRAEGERADRADRLADYYRAAEDRAIRAAVRAEERARSAEQEELRGREERIGASHGEYALRTGLDHARRAWRERARRAEEAATCKWQHRPCVDCGAMTTFIGQGLYECWKCTAVDLRAAAMAAEHDLAIVRHNSRLRARGVAAIVRERGIAEAERDEARHELVELRADIAGMEARLRAGVR